MMDATDHIRRRILAMVGEDYPLLGLLTELEGAIRADHDAELERLRRQNHDAAERHDKKMAVLQSTVDRYLNAYERARAIVRGTPVDWTGDPPSQKPDGWWNYTSQQNRDIIAAVVVGARAEVEQLQAIIRRDHAPVFGTFIMDESKLPLPDPEAQALVHCAYCHTAWPCSVREAVR